MDFTKSCHEDIQVEKILAKIPKNITNFIYNLYASNTKMTTLEKTIGLMQVIFNTNPFQDEKNYDSSFEKAKKTDNLRAELIAKLNGQLQLVQEYLSLAEQNTVEIDEYALREIVGESVLLAPFGYSFGNQDFEFEKMDKIMPGTYAQITEIMKGIRGRPDYHAYPLSYLKLILAPQEIRIKNRISEDEAIASEVEQIPPRPDFDSQKSDYEAQVKEFNSLYSGLVQVTLEDGIPLLRFAAMDANEICGDISGYLNEKKVQYGIKDIEIIEWGADPCPGLEIQKADERSSFIFVYKKSLSRENTAYIQKGDIYNNELKENHLEMIAGYLASKI